MTYEVYRLSKMIDEYLKEDVNDSYKNEAIFKACVSCFNIIADTCRYNKGAPYFNLKLNWALLKKQCFNAVLTNIEKWLNEANPEGYNE